MPFNLLKQYPDVLDIIMSEADRYRSLRGVFNRDIQNNSTFSFRTKRIYPIKEDGEIDMAMQFTHLTCVEIQDCDELGNLLPKVRVFDPDRSKRLHWIKHHINEKTPSNIVVFTVHERDMKKRCFVDKTYVYDKVQKYVIVLECQRSNTTYRLLSAYYFNRPYAEKEINKKIQRKLNEVL